MIAQPVWLLLPLLPVFLLVFQALRGPSGASEMPGAWSRQITASLSAFMRLSVHGHDRHTGVWRRLCLVGLWLLLCAALAAISMGHSKTPTLGNLHARVVLIDMGQGEQSRMLVHEARKFVAAEADADTPTGIVALTSEAFDVVPVTTDHAHIERYLRVLDAGVMPVSGRRPEAGIRAAANMLERGQILAPQIVYFAGASPVSGGAMPEPAIATARQIDPDLWLIVQADTQRAGWREFAAQHAANIVTVEQPLTEIYGALSAARDRRAASAVPIRERRELTPLWLLSCLPLWLWLYFRRQPG